jgi:hypothetical protein
MGGKGGASGEDESALMHEVRGGGSSHEAMGCGVLRWGSIG